MNNSNKYLLGILFLFFLNCTKKETEVEIVNDTQLYTLNIEVGESIPIDDKINMTLHIFDGLDTIIYDARIERRGGSSIVFPKHSYEIDLNEDVSLAGLEEDDDWLLVANYIDKTFLRHVISYELFADMNENNQVSQTKYVEVELNGDYNGLYVLMEKLDKSSLNVKGKNSGAVIFKEPHIFRENYDGIVPQKENNFHQQTYPKIKDKDKTVFIEGVRSFVMCSSDIDFINQFSSVFDIQNIIDWHLLLLISNNSDGILKNFYLYKVDEDTPIRVAPWDYDHSFGRDGDNELNLDERPLDVKRSILFKRLLKFEWYKDSLKQRWNELNEIGLFSEFGLKQRVTEKSEGIEAYAKKNFQTWPIDASWYYDANGFDKEVSIMLEFIEIRHNRLVAYFDSL